MFTTTKLGHGIGLRTRHYTHLLEHGPSGVDWFEVISENFFEAGGRPWAVLEKVRACVPVVMHGVSLGIGNVDPVPDSYVESLRALIARLEPALVSDHLCWGGFAGHHSHDLLPLPYTEEALAHVVGKVKKLQDRLGRRILLENPSTYLTFAASTMPEWEFLGAIAKQADCGILLDVNNVYVSSQNHGFDAHAYIDAIDPARVGQIHVAGHSHQHDVIVDTHIGPTPDPVWALYRRTIRRMGAVPTLVEWDAQIPEYEEVVADSQRARGIEREELGDAR